MLSTLRQKQGLLQVQIFMICIGFFVGNNIHAQKDSFPKLIYLQPLGTGMTPSDIHIVQTALEQTYGFQVKVQSPIELPQSAYFPDRKRYRAEKLIAFLRNQLPKEGDYILGLTAVDISTTNGKISDWGVMGLAGDIGNGEKAAIFSIFRCKKKGATPLLARQRVAKTAVHELGHVLGLEHCNTFGCLMQDAKAKVSTSDQEYDLCPLCRKQLQDSGILLPSHPKFPWPHP